jgi:hypothetical protein
VSFRRSAVALVVALALPRLAAAQPTGAASPAIGRLDGSRLTAGRWTYSQSMTMGGQSRDLGTRTLTLAPATFRGAATWLIVDEAETEGAQVVDSLYVVRADLAPVRRVMHVTLPQGPVEIVNEFGKDSITGSITAQGNKLPVAMKNRPGLVANSGQLELMLRLAPLRAGWSGRADVLLPALMGAGTAAVDVSVTGEERVTVPAGTMDAWIAVVRGSAGEQRLWIDKVGRRIVRLSSPLPMASGAAVEMVLLPDSSRAR